jgi:hypothetical protein
MHTGADPNPARFADATLPAVITTGPRMGGEGRVSCHGAYLSAPAVRPLTKRRCMATYSTVTGTDNTTTPAKM